MKTLLLKASSTVVFVVEMTDSKLTEIYEKSDEIYCNLHYARGVKGFAMLNPANSCFQFTGTIGIQTTTNLQEFGSCHRVSE